MIAVHRVVWHPGMATSLIAVLCLAGAIAAPVVGVDAMSWPWLVLGLAAGFATSGST
jgi:hypothetical protein